MPIPTPFHACTAPLCESYDWRDWSGYLAAGLYLPTHEREYYAIRNSAGLIDVSPLYKYLVSGPDALKLVDRVMTRDMTRCAVGQVFYSPWCDEHGKMIDDGTISRLSEYTFRITSALPNLRWFQDCGYGLKAIVSDISDQLGALALQGPKSREILRQLVSNIDIDALKFFRLVETTIDDFAITITRTGYTGDLGYELWVAPEHAPRLWELLMGQGRAYGILPAGLVALDMVRIEGGLPLIEVDYLPAPHALIEQQKSSPYEVGMGWTVALNAGNFVGRKALRAEHERGSHWAFVGLDVHWPDIEDLYQQVGLTPMLAGRASRGSVPVYHQGRQIGQATSHTYSPMLKNYIALATIESEYAQPGARLDLEMTVEFTRQTATATVVKLPFFNPPRKRTP